MSQAKKIRVALIGLSASAKTSWASDAHLPYLLSPNGQSHYTIVALLNSSVSAAEAARTTYKLPSSVKAYGNPEDLAKDPNIDLVVCNTRVDVHFDSTAPSLRAGKAVYIEWPLTENLQKAIELTGNSKIPDSIIGNQGRVAPITLRLKEVIASGTIGKVLNSTIQAFGNLSARDTVSESLTYFVDRKVGGHPLNIHYGHLIDFVHEVLGEWEDFDAKLQIQRPVVKVIDGQGQEKGEIKADVPDFINVHGTLQQGVGKAELAPNASLAVTFRVGPPFKGQPGLVWSINGTEGELLLTAPGPYLMAHTYFHGPVKLELHDFKTDEVRDLGWDWQDWQKELPILSRSVGELYERYAKWVESGKPEEVQQGENWPRLHDAVERLEEFDKLYKQFDPNW